MKTKQAVFAVIAVLALALAFTACSDGSGSDGGTRDTHTHSYSDAWSYDETGHWHECTANDGAKTDIAGHTEDPCEDCGYDSSLTLVTFSKLTANGNEDNPTATLTLTFDQAVTGLSADDITLSAAGIRKEGALFAVKMGSLQIYTLTISGSISGTLTVTVSKPGYSISGSSKTVAVYGATSGGGIEKTMAWTAVTDSTFGPTDIRAVAYGNNRWVAAGGDGTMAYSSDNGVTWTAVSNSTFGDSGIRGIAYGNNRFVAVGVSSKMAYSTDDGVTWTAVSNSIFGSGFLNAINAVAYSNNRFVAVGVYGKMAYSTDDGESWTAVEDSTFGSSILKLDDINSIAYGSNRFVAVGGQGKMAYSTDGENWTAESNNTFGTSTINSIAYGNSSFVAVGNGGQMAYADW